MKKRLNIVLTAFSVIALMGVVSCKKVEELAGNNGSTIRFGVSTIYENGPATKTEYSGKDQSNNSISSTSIAERIDWLATDKIRIQCAQASVEGSSDKYADYAITPGSPGTTQVHTATISPIGNGLQWGTGSILHDFYALYPSTAQNSDSNIAVSGTGATVKGTFPAAQTVTRDGYTFKPDMDYAYMYAVTAGVTGGTDVSLDFRPLVTTLEFTLLTKASDPITSKLTSVKLSSSQSTSYLTGNFTAALTTSGLTAVTMGDITGGGNEITITLPDGGVQLSTNATEAYKVTFLTLPLDQTELTLTLGFADSSQRTLELKDNGSWITLYACTKTYIWKLDAPKTVSTGASISGGEPYKFGDAYLTNGILKKTDATFSIEEDPFVLCTEYNGTVPTQGSSSGTRYYFNYIELGQYFSNDPSFDNNSGNIPSVQTVSYNGQNWRMPSQVEWAAATTAAGRTGSTVNGTSGARFAKVNVDLTGSVHAGEGLTTSGGDGGTSTNYMAALLLFPDGATVTCNSINSSSINSIGASFATSTVSYADISTLVSGGCVVLPAGGFYNSNWKYGGTYGLYWSGTQFGTDNTGYYMLFYFYNVNPGININKSTCFFPVVLARADTEISGGEPYKFGDAYLTNGILKKTDATFSIEEDPFVLRTAYDGTAPTQGSSSGTRYYFDYIELGQYFSNDPSFDSNSGNIPSVQTVSYNGQNWRMPSQVEWAAATTAAGRTGSTVNGTSGARFAKVNVDLTGSVHEGEAGELKNRMKALLLFPDGATVTCNSINSSSINGIGASFATSTVSYADISTLVSGGCVVIPAGGYYLSTNSFWGYGGSNGYYWSGTQYSSYSGYNLFFSNDDVGPDDRYNKSHNFFPVVLARKDTEISGGEPYKFGDVYLTNGILKKTDATFSIEEDPFVLRTAYDGTVPIQGSSSGTRYYFNYIELGQYFSNNPSFDNNSGNIPSVQTVSYNGQNWRMPSRVEWAAATTAAGRTGSTVNGTSGARFAKVLVDLTGSVHEGEAGELKNRAAALLLFPDGATVTCESINSSSINGSGASYATSTVSYADILTLVSGGCVVLPAGGYYYSNVSGWSYGGLNGYYWSGTQYDTGNGYAFNFSSLGVGPGGYAKSNFFFPVVLAR